MGSILVGEYLFTLKIRAKSLKDESVWWSHLMKIQIVFMDHILFEKLRKKGEKKLCGLSRGIFLFLPPTEGWMTIKLCMRYLKLQGLDLSSNCFMKLSTWWVFRKKFVELWRCRGESGGILHYFQSLKQILCAFLRSKTIQDCFFLN